jgi:Uma2 family endonuclease
MRKTLVKVGPQDRGRRMSLEDFDHAEVVEGYRYELGRGVIDVSDIPGKRHLKQFLKIRDALLRYDIGHPGRIHAVAGGAECKILAASHESERHPDIAVYLSPAPEGDDIWSSWIPDIVIQIVSRGSKRRDYEEKPDEYLAFGVREYWIVDASKEEMLILRRRGGRWAERGVKSSETYKTRLLPGFELDLAALFAAAREVAD